MTTIRYFFLLSLLALLVAMEQLQAASEAVLRSFTSVAHGAYPQGGVIRDSANNLYGATTSGGSGNQGVIFKLDKNGKQTVLYSFQWGYSYSSLVGDPSGNLYGTVTFGSSGEGEVFKLDQAGTYSVLHSFSFYDGANPYAGVVRDAAGNLYGTTYYGGTFYCGVVYKLDPAGTYTVLYAFSGNNDGYHPYAGVTLDSEGNLYGTTESGGTAGDGVIYKLDPSGNETVLYNFTGGSDGQNPDLGVIRDAAGDLYGAVMYGGGIGWGNVYKLDATGKFTVLYAFTGGSDGASPNGVVEDPAGNLYGTAYGGAQEAGLVFKLNPAGQFTILCTFPGGVTGVGPSSGVILDRSGNLYGTTYQGGTNNLGVVYEVDTTGHDTALYSFSGAFAGSSPSTRLTRDAAGNLYGTTKAGGVVNAGVVYKLDSQNRETILYSFTGGPDGANPSSGVIRDGVGNLYGTTTYGDLNLPYETAGVLYKIDPAGQETVLHTFLGGADGFSPTGELIFDSAGTLYGVTKWGGTGGAGIVYKVDRTGKETIIYNFSGKGDGGQPGGGVIRDGAGNLYGSTWAGGVTTTGSGWGVAYKLDPAGNETILHTFTGGVDGGYPSGTFAHDPAGNLYGMTASGGANGLGLVYKLDLAGHQTVLHDFADSDGGDPQGSLIRDPGGNLYGTTYSGGTGGFGVVYKLDAAGQETVLYNFTGGLDGGRPEGGVIPDPAGNLYGTTTYGGKVTTGVVFKLTL